MALEKRPSDKSGNVSVIFRVPPDAAAGSAELLGEFTDWVPVPMEPRDDGGHELVIDLVRGTAYRFRYRLDGERWVNDWAADDYVANDYGSDDSVVVISDIEIDVEAAPPASAPAVTPAPPKVAAKATPKPAKKAAAKTPAKAAVKSTAKPAAKSTTKAAAKAPAKKTAKSQNGIAAAAANAKAAVEGEAPKRKRAPRQQS